VAHQEPLGIAILVNGYWDEGDATVIAENQVSE
jgi:hypothetical protein